MTARTTLVMQTTPLRSEHSRVLNWPARLSQSPGLLKDATGSSEQNLQVFRAVQRPYSAPSVEKR